MKKKILCSSRFIRGTRVKHQLTTLERKSQFLTRKRGGNSRNPSSRVGISIYMASVSSIYIPVTFNGIFLPIFFGKKKHGHDWPGIEVTPAREFREQERKRRKKTKKRLKKNSTMCIIVLKKVEGKHLTVHHSLAWHFSPWLSPFCILLYYNHQERQCPGKIMKENEVLY